MISSGCKLHQPDGPDSHCGHAELQPEGHGVFQRGVPNPLHGLRPQRATAGEWRDDL